MQAARRASVRVHVDIGLDAAAVGELSPEQQRAVYAGVGALVRQVGELEEKLRVALQAASLHEFELHAPFEHGHVE